MMAPPVSRTPPLGRIAGTLLVIGALARCGGANRALGHSLARPNIVFLICESIDGRTFHADSPVPLPNIDKLRFNGSSFHNHYVNAPVCAASRSSLWSGRLPHHIPHETWGVKTDVVWGNGEGLPPGYDDKIGDVLERQGYDVRISGKTDWTTGGHAEWNWMQWWTMYAQFPYNLSSTEADNWGWDEQPDPNPCQGQGTVTAGNTSHQNDWDNVKKTTSWIRDHNSTTPWFAYQGMDIVHPPYVAAEKWFNAIDDAKITVPEWPALTEMHPCSFQSSMLKGCVPSIVGDQSAFYSKARRRRIRKIYYAMIAEFDAMVGEYISAVHDAGAMDKTWFIVTADHGDMQMEHQQFYKMVPYDGSSTVPLVVWSPVMNSPHTHTAATSHISLFPTIMDIAGVPRPSWPEAVEGGSLYPVLMGEALLPTNSTAVSQFHGADTAMSWYLIRQGDMKLVVYGTNEEVDPQLFNITADPGEYRNLVRDEPQEAARLEAALRAVIDYPKVSYAAAKYQQDVFRIWRQRYNSTWQKRLEGFPAFSNSWSHNGGALKALEDWISRPPTIRACRGALAWPPTEP